MASKDALLRLTSRLMRRRDTLRRSLEGDIDSLRMASTVNGVGDSLDAAVNATNGEICSQLAELESRELGRIEHALQMIALGAYGRCELCGGKISAARLSALPYATRCIDCQRKEERQGNSGGPELDSKPWARIEDGSIGEGDDDAQIELGTLELNFSE